MQITENLFVAYCQCPYKAFLKSKGEVGEVVDYEVIQKEADTRFRDQAIERLLRSHTESQVTREPASLRLAIKEGVTLILGARVEASGVALRFDLLERQVDRDDDRRAVYVPVLFSHRNKLTREDSLLAAFHGIILAEALGQPVPFVKVVHGPGFSVSKIKLVGPTGPTRLVKEARQTPRQAEETDRIHLAAVDDPELPLPIVRVQGPLPCRGCQQRRPEPDAGHVGEGDPRPAKTGDHHRDPVCLHVPTQEHRAKEEQTSQEASSCPPGFGCS